MSKMQLLVPSMQILLVSVSTRSMFKKRRTFNKNDSFVVRSSFLSKAEYSAVSSLIRHTGPLHLWILLPYLSSFRQGTYFKRIARDLCHVKLITMTSQQQATLTLRRLENEKVLLINKISDLEAETREHKYDGFELVLYLELHRSTCSRSSIIGIP